MQPNQEWPHDHHPPQARERRGESHDHTRDVPSLSAIVGHPIHPVIVPLPIACLVGTLASDIGFWWTDDRFWARSSLWLSGTGVVTGMGAAVPGLIDFLAIDRERVHRVG